MELFSGLCPRFIVTPASLWNMGSTKDLQSHKCGLCNKYRKAKVDLEVEAKRTGLETKIVGFVYLIRRRDQIKVR